MHLKGLCRSFDCNSKRFCQAVNQTKGGCKKPAFSFITFLPYLRFMAKQKTQTIPLSSLKPNKDNPRIIKDEKFEKLVKSLQDFPQMMEKRPITIDSWAKPVVLGGNMRLKALAYAGYKEIPKSWVQTCEGWTEAQKKEFIIKDNVGFGEWDWELINAKWNEDELSLWGLDTEPFSPVFEPLNESYPEHKIIKTDIKAGDLFEIGTHRLICGDSTDPETIKKLMNNRKSELLFTSPPYSNMRVYSKNADLSINKIIDFIPTFEPYSKYLVVNLGIQRINNEVNQYWDEYIREARSAKYKFLSWNVWNRNQARSISQHSAFISIAHEFLFVFGKEFKTINKTVSAKTGGKITKSTNQNIDGSRFKRKYKTAMFKKITTVTTTDVEHNAPHPAAFPVALPHEYIQALTKKGDVITEPFNGWGTTMVASEMLGRSCYASEISPEYCQRTINRLQKLVPSIVIKKNGKSYKNLHKDGKEAKK